MSEGTEAKVPTVESKLTLTNRLRREGRWEEATVYKDEMIRHLRDTKTLLGSAAKERAWELMAEKYPPLSPDEMSKKSEKKFEPLDVADNLPDSTPDTFLQDATWVYNNLRRGSVSGNAPTSGAVGLLEWARDNPNDFYKQTWPKALGLASNQKPDADDETQANLDHVANLEEMLRG